jgi:hypothetical protein
MYNENKLEGKSITCGGYEVVINRQAIGHTPNKDYKKMISDKLVKRIIEYRENRIDSLRNRKEEIMNSVKKDIYQEYNVDCSEELLVSEYFDYILNLFENDDMDNRYKLDTLTYFENITICPHCHNAVFYYENKVCCINQCLGYKLLESTISLDFTLDNFMDIYKGCYNEHLMCGGRLELVQLENGHLLFICTSCDSI